MRVSFSNLNKNLLLSFQKFPIKFTCFEFVSAAWLNRIGKRPFAKSDDLPARLRSSRLFSRIDRRQFKTLPGYSVVGQKNKACNNVSHVVLLIREKNGVFIYEKFTYGEVKKIPVSHWNTFINENPLLYVIRPELMRQMINL